jgi:uncharacterized repeat protein (TIGR03837 family)
MHNAGMQPTAPSIRPTDATPPSLRWDVFCRVVDNFGDIGVCWRLCANLAARGHTVRLWVDDASALDWMAPGARAGQWPGVQVYAWASSHDAAVLVTLEPADVWIEGFGCEIAPEFIAARAMSMGIKGQFDINIPVWINLEYLSAESYVERCHGLPSPILHGPAQGWTKHFYYPGFTANTGGLLREWAAEPHPRQPEATARRAWLAQHGVDWQGETLISLFCYAPVALPALLESLAGSTRPTLILVTPGRAQAAVRTWLAAHGGIGADQPNGIGTGALRLHFLPALTQLNYDLLLSTCDLNFVRGEDSLIRAIWAGQPWVWQIYPQDDDAHAEKLLAVLDQIQAPGTLRAAHLTWNRLTTPETKAVDWADLPQPEWIASAQKLRQRLAEMPDLVSQLIGFVQKKR